MGALFGITLLAYVQVKLGWSLGFGIPTVAMISSIFMLGAGYVKYRYQKSMGSAFTRFIQVIVASVRNLANGFDVAKGGACLYRRKGSTTAWVIITATFWVIILIHLQGIIAALYREMVSVAISSSFGFYIATALSARFLMCYDGRGFKRAVF